MRQIAGLTLKCLTSMVLVMAIAVTVAIALPAPALRPASRGAGVAGVVVTVRAGMARVTGGVSALYPGRGVDEIPFTVTAPADTSVMVVAASAEVAADDRGEAENGGDAPIAGCLARWFPVTVQLATVRPPVRLTPGTRVHGFIAVRMLNAPVSQDACQHSRPRIVVRVSTRRAATLHR